MKKNLVIVESPAKARTLEKILGNNYVIEASMGHVRDLPKSRIGVDVEHDFEPKYVVPRDKSKLVKELKEAVKKAGTVYLATDPDREGEAIAWHLAEVTNQDHTPFKRITFHEITATAIEEAVQHPRKIDMQLVNAQQARRILDRLVGYRISPLLWQKVRRGLSAGRVQSVAVKIIVDREREIAAFVAEEYWTIAAELDKKTGKAPSFEANLVGKTDGGKLAIGNKKMADAVLAELGTADYVVLKVTSKEARRTPAPPFITSSLQQEAWRRFRFTAKRTMAIAQQLYEGLSVGEEGSVGLITYMRTDSTHVAKEAVAEARSYIKGKYGDKYLPVKPRVYAARVKGAQEAHEAIRPTKILRDPTSIKGFLNNDQNKLYQLIWQRMVASQMAEAVFANTTVDTEARARAAKNNYLLRSFNSVNIFPGFMALYAERKDDETEEKVTPALPELTKGEALKLLKLTPEKRFTQPPPRYTEATLIRVLEQNGIGRPSTYAPTVSTIQDREYVTREGGSFKPTELGFTVTDLLVNNFNDIVNIDFTAKMEAQLDKIAGNDENWVDVVREFYQPLARDLEKAEATIEKVNLAPEVSEETCPKCGQARMVIKLGRYGKYMECPGCAFRQSFRIHTSVPCPDCPEKGELIGRFNKKGKIFYGCSAFPKHKFALNLKPVKEPCPNCGGLMTEYGKDVRCTKCKYKAARMEPAA